MLVGLLSGVLSWEGSREVSITIVQVEARESSFCRRRVLDVRV